MKCASLTLLFAASLTTFAQDDLIPDGAAVQEDATFKIFPDPGGDAYFPEGKESYYTRYLSAMKEPSVKAPLEEGVTRVFRFTYLRSFHDPLAVRIVETGDTLTARAIHLENDREYNPVKIVHDKTWTLDAENSKVVHALMEQKGFWEPLNASEQLMTVLDGSSWIFEIHDKDGYRMISVSSPRVITIPEETLKAAGVDPSKLRDFLVYKKTGNALLEMGKILPEPEHRY